MFRKIVSNLAFSPALVGQLGFYARRLKKEEATRRLGMVFTAFALIVQSLTVFTPPQAANADTPGRVGNAPRCEVKAVGPRDSAFAVNADNTKATVTFDVSGGKKCKVQVTANSFYAPSMDGKPYDKQVLFGERNTKIYDTPGRYSLVAQIPTKDTGNGCFYQLDLTYGTYNVTPVLAYAHGKVNGCKPPVLSTVGCGGLAISQVSPGSFIIAGSATTVGEGKVKAFVFNVYHNGTLNKKHRIDTDKKSATWTYTNNTPGSYAVNTTIKSSVGDVESPRCNGSFTVVPIVTAQPVADCSSVEASITNRTQVYLSGTAQASGGATISSYTFIIKNHLGIEVKNIPVASTGTTAQTSAVDITNPGDYTVQLVVQTSLGDKTNDSTCVKKFTITPPEVCQFNPSLPPSDPNCQPCPGDSTIWIKDENCSATIISSKTGTNLTQGSVGATTVTARASDRISYTLTVENTGTDSETVTIHEDLTDILEYASLVDTGGGDYNETTKTLSWAAFSLEPGKKQSRTILVQVLDQIPAINTGLTNTESFNCVMTNTFGNSLNTKMDCPIQKEIVEQVVSELPSTGPTENMIFAGFVGAIVTFFWARSRQLGKEVRLIRKDFNMGTI